MAQNDQEIPSWQEIRKVLDYKENGSAAILYDTRITSRVEKADPVDNLTEIKQDSSATVWMKFLLPKNIKEERYTLLIKKGPIPVLTKQLKLSLKSNNGALVYRTWRSHSFKKLGRYKVEIYFEENLIKSIDIEVVEN